jgi:iron-sulfur cluster repair protein YtfE (RIC family)
MPPIQSHSNNLLQSKVNLFNLIAHILVHFHSLLFHSQLSALANVIIKIYRVTAELPISSAWLVLFPFRYLTKNQ